MQGEKRIIIAGTRTFSDYPLVERTLLEHGITGPQCGGDNIVIVSGGAKGADSLGERFAKKYGIPVRRFLPDWNRYGKAAGPFRNEAMARFASEPGAEGALFAFWDEKSRGTQSMIMLADRYGLDVHIVQYGTSVQATS